MDKDYGVVISVENNIIDVISIKEGENFLKKEYNLTVQTYTPQIGEFCSLEYNENEQLLAILKSNLNEEEFQILSSLSEDALNTLINKMHPGRPHTHDGQVDEPPPFQEGVLVVKAGHEHPKHIDEGCAGGRHDFVFDFEKKKFQRNTQVTFFGISYKTKNYAVFVFRK
jgi:hypothetical protein